MPGAGIYKFTKHQLEEYRKEVLNPVFGKELLNTFESLLKKGYDFGGKNYKKEPKGYNIRLENVELLLYDGLYVSKSINIPEAFFSFKFIDFCLKTYKEMLPIQKWLLDLAKK